MQNDLDWRHALGAALLLLVLGLAGWKLLARPAAPAVSAPAGVNVRGQDAPAQAHGAPAQPGLPAAR